MLSSPAHSPAESSRHDRTGPTRRRWSFARDDGKCHAGNSAWTLAWRSSGRGPTVVFFAGALANGDLWRDVVVALEDRYRCITIDLPLGAHPWPLSKEADRSATSLARLLLDCLELLDVEDATVVANDTAGGLLLLSLGNWSSGARASGPPRADEL